MAVSISGFSQQGNQTSKNSDGSVNGSGRYIGSSADSINPHGIKTILSEPIDFSIPKVLLFQIRNNDTGAYRYELEDASGNVRYWTTSILQYKRGTFQGWIIFGSNYPGAQEDPGFDLTNVVAVNHLKIDPGSTNALFYFRVWVIDSIKISAIDGDDSSFQDVSANDPSPFSFQSIISTIPYPIVIGNDDSTVFSEGSFSGCSFDLETTDPLIPTESGQYLLSKEFSQVKSNLASSTVIPLILLLHKSYENLSSAVVTHRGWTIIEGHTKLNFGTGILEGVNFFSCDVPVVGGSVFNRVEVSGSKAPEYAVDWGSSVVISQLSIQGSNAAAIRIRESKTLKNFTFAENGYDFFVDVDSGSVTITVDEGSQTDHVGGFSASDYVASKVLSAGATVVVSAPQKTIRFFGIPNVSGALLYVENLNSGDILYPPLTNGEVTINANEAHQYRIRAIAPGYSPSRFSVIPGSVSQFEFALESYRDLYEQGVNRSSQIVIDFVTFEAVIGDEVDLPFADVVRTFSDAISTQQGILLPVPPEPIVVDIGGSRRNFLFFPYDEVLDQVNPVKIKPNPANTRDPKLLDFVIVFVGADEPLYDGFDFSGGSQFIRFQTESVATTANADLSGLSGMESQLSDLHSTLQEPGVFAASALVNFDSGSPEPVSRFDINLIARAEEDVETPQEIRYREVVFCPDALGGDGQVFIGKSDGSHAPLVTVSGG